MSFWAQLTMSARAFSITLFLSSVCLSVRLSVRPSVRLLDYFSKPVSSYMFNLIAFKFYTVIKYADLACACFGVWTILVFLANFWNFWNNGIIYSNCKMHLLLRFSSNRFEIMHGSFIAHKHYILCFFHDRTILKFLANFWILK